MGKEEKKFLPKTQCESMLNGIEDALYVLGGKWKLRIIVGLLDGNKRFNELQRTVKGISAKVLSDELKKLELNGFIQRKVYADTHPIIVEYILTDYAMTLEDLLHSLSQWGEEHKERIKAQLRKSS